jgi:hypothetical protein
MTYRYRRVAPVSAPPHDHDRKPPPHHLPIAASWRGPDRVVWLEPWLALERGCVEGPVAGDAFEVVGTAIGELEA